LKALHGNLFLFCKIAAENQKALSFVFMKENAKISWAKTQAAAIFPKGGSVVSHETHRLVSIDILRRTNSKATM
jgi:hypothetical protein